MKTTDFPIIVEQLLKGDMDLVWSVLTEIDHMRQWFFKEIPAFKAERGFETNFVINTGERDFDHRWKIVNVESKRRITYNWHYAGYSGDSLVHFELFPENEMTLIRLTTEVLEDFPEEIPEFKRESAIGGWNYFIKESLPSYIDSLS